MGAERPEVVPLEEVPAGEVLALLETCLGPGAVERDEAFWRWKHERNPFGRSPGLVALAGGRPVALRVFLRWRWAAGGRSVEAVRAVDTATHPDWRRRGLFRRLTLELVEKARAEGAAFVFNTPNPGSRAGYLRMGWQDVGRVPLRVALRRPVRVLRSLLRRTDPDPAAREWRPESLRAIHDLLEQPGLPGLLAGWTEREQRLHTPRTPEYLRWRYQEVPGVDYGALWRLDGSSGAVLVVRGRLRRGLREITLSEIMLSHDSAGRQAGRELVERVGNLKGADYVAAAALPGSREEEVLRDRGWLRLPVGPRRTVRTLRPLTPDPGQPASWRLSIGDLELF